MKRVLLPLLFSAVGFVALHAQELKIRANSFTSDQKKGISVFKGDVNIIKEHDELNASQLTVFTDKNNRPKKFVAVGDVSFRITTKDGSIYEGVANKSIYLPKKREYYFYKNVHLRELHDKKEILGDEVVLKTQDGKAYAKGLKKEPVIMIFDIDEEK